MSSVMKNIANMLAEMTFLKDYVKEAAMIAVHYSKKLFAEIGNRIGKDRIFAMTLTPE